ncbi:anti-sigma factor [Georgenia wutianyii]|uniref:Anti-sigma factor n=1 Tax=Georgenia wutianyii TaxID=2585135 RepID=A0ABX5VPL1_9MICO|nr:anti-sigma factor [Georgenia wutianyii]QDB80387.1 anti-sigma factor [Georgenia wutianyii]
MRHVDDDTLSLVALGEAEPDAAAAEHLRECAQCREELAALSDMVTAGRAGSPLQAPPAHVWDRIAEEIAAQGVDDGAPDDGAPDAGTPEAGAPEAGPERDEPLVPPRVPAGRRRDRTRPPGRREPRRSRWSRAGWLAAGLAAGVAGTLLVTQLPERSEEPEALATAQLEPLPGWDETGTARVEDVDGRRVLHVELPGDPQDGYREVWLLDESVQRLVSVGLLVGDEGTFDLPPGLDLDDLAVVDVSREPFDGDPAHSGDSIVRGRLDS